MQALSITRIQASLCFFCGITNLQNNTIIVGLIAYPKILKTVLKKGKETEVPSIFSTTFCITSKLTKLIMTSIVFRCSLFMYLSFSTANNKPSSWMPSDKRIIYCVISPFLQNLSIILYSIEELISIQNFWILYFKRNIIA